MFLLILSLALLMAFVMGVGVILEIEGHPAANAVCLVVFVFLVMTLTQVVRSLEDRAEPHECPNELIPVVIYDDTTVATCVARYEIGE